MSDAAQAGEQNVGEQLLAICERVKAVVEKHLGSDYKVLDVNADLIARYSLIERQPSPTFDQVLTRWRSEFHVEACNIGNPTLSERVTCRIHVGLDGKVRIEQTITTREEWP